MAKHVHIHFLPRRTRDQAPGSVPKQAGQAIPPAQVAKLVEALMQALAARGHTTADAQARARNGQFASGSGGEKMVRSGAQHTDPHFVFPVDKSMGRGKSGTLLAGIHWAADNGAPKRAAARAKGVHATLVKAGKLNHPSITEQVEAAKAKGSLFASHLHALIKGTTHDAGEWDESKHPRAEGGQFTSAQHGQAAANHESAAAGHENAAAMSGAGPLVAMHQKAAAAHKDAAEAHSTAAKHMDAGTGLGEEFAAQAHSKSYMAAGHSKKLEPLAGGNTMGAAYAHLKKIASDPKTPVNKRAEAVEQLAKIEKSANKVAESPHAAKPQVSGPSTGQRDPGEKFAGAMAANKGGSGSMESQAAAAGGAGPAGDKPTQATAKGAKAATHQLLSSGHPFSLDELMKATGVTNKATIMTALSDLKNPKYAGALGALQIAKRDDGMFHVTTAPAGGFKAVGAASAAASAAASPSGGGSTPSATPTGGADPAPTDPHAVVHGSHPLSDFMPNQMLTAKGSAGAQYKVLGHNAEGKVVVQHATKGGKHAMDPADLKKVMAASPAAAPAKAAEGETGPIASKAELDQAKSRNDFAERQKVTPSAPVRPLNGKTATEVRENLRNSGGASAKSAAEPSPTKPVTVKEAPNQAYGKAEGLKPGPGNTNVREGQPLHSKPGPDGKPMGEHPALTAAKKAVAANPRTTGGGGHSSPEQIRRLQAMRAHLDYKQFGSGIHTAPPVNRADLKDRMTQAKKVMGKSAGPIQQENRNLEAKQLKESRQMIKTSGPGTTPSVRLAQARADVAARKKPAAGRENDDYGRGNVDNVPQNGQAGMKSTTKPIAGATATGQSFMQRVPISKAKKDTPGKA